MCDRLFSKTDLSLVHNKFRKLITWTRLAVTGGIEIRGANRQRPVCFRAKHTMYFVTSGIISRWVWWTRFSFDECPSEGSNVPPRDEMLLRWIRSICTVPFTFVLFFNVLSSRFAGSQTNLQKTRRQTQLCKVADAVRSCKCFRRSLIFWIVNSIPNNDVA